MYLICWNKGGAMGLKLLALGVALTLPLAMFGQSSPATQKKNNGHFSQGDAMFLKALIQEDISEISLAKMALQKSATPEVKQYARRKILAADPQMRDGAAQIARAGNLQSPTRPNARQRKIHHELAKKTGKYFDNAYMNYEASQQTADVKLVKTEIESSSNAQVKNYATKEEAPVEEAASAARDISAKVSTAMTSYRHQVTHKPGH